jgi:hypothetical protein
MKLAPRISVWRWAASVEWPRFAVIFWATAWAFKVVRLEPEPQPEDGVFGSPPRMTRAWIVRIGPLMIVAESKRPTFSSALLPWGASW